MGTNKSSVINFIDMYVRYIVFWQVADKGFIRSWFLEIDSFNPCGGLAN